MSSVLPGCLEQESAVTRAVKNIHQWHTGLIVCCRCYLTLLKQWIQIIKGTGTLFRQLAWVRAIFINPFTTRIFFSHPWWVYFTFYPPPLPKNMTVRLREKIQLHTVRKQSESPHKNRAFHGRRDAMLNKTKSRYVGLLQYLHIPGTVCIWLRNQTFTVESSPSVTGSVFVRRTVTGYFWHNCTQCTLTWKQNNFCLIFKLLHMHEK